MKKKKIKVIYESNWDSATSQQKREFTERLNQSYDILFQRILEIKIKEKAYGLPEMSDN